MGVFIRPCLMIAILLLHLGGGPSAYAGRVGDCVRGVMNRIHQVSERRRLVKEAKRSLSESPETLNKKNLFDRIGMKCVSQSPVMKAALLSKMSLNAVSFMALYGIQLKHGYKEISQACEKLEDHHFQVQSDKALRRRTSEVCNEKYPAIPLIANSLLFNLLDAELTCRSMSRKSNLDVGKMTYKDYLKANYTRDMFKEKFKWAVSFSLSYPIIKSTYDYFMNVEDPIDFENFKEEFAREAKLREMGADFAVQLAFEMAIIPTFRTPIFDYWRFRTIPGFQNKVFEVLKNGAVVSKQGGKLRIFLPKGNERFAQMAAWVTRQVGFGGTRLIEWAKIKLYFDAWNDSDLKQQIIGNPPRDDTPIHFDMINMNEEEMIAQLRQTNPSQSDSSPVTSIEFVQVN